MTSRLLIEKGEWFSYFFFLLVVQNVLSEPRREGWGAWGSILRSSFSCWRKY